MPLRQHCNSCRRQTNHLELAYNEKETTQVYGEKDDPWTLVWRDRYMIVTCSGCDSISFRHTSTEENDPDPAFVRLYPDVLRRLRPVWLESLPKDMARLLRQTYHALDARHGALALMGARAVADVLLLDKVGDAGGFGEKMAKLQAEGHVSAKNADILDAALDAGHAAAHRGYEPATEELNAVMDILENLLQAVYHLEGLATRLRGTTPSRKARPA